MATATAEPHAHAVGTPAHGAKKDETEKEKLDRENAEYWKANPSSLPVPPQKSETDNLRDYGFPVVEIAVAPLPGGGPSTEPGLSAGTPPPSLEAIQQGLDEQATRLEEQNKEREKALDERKKAEKERLDALAKANKQADKDAAKHAVK